jgi:DNA-binding GntR family transcriptional regulator
MDTIQQMETGLDCEDRDAWALADDRFHVALVRLSGNRRLQAIVGMMADHVRRARATTLYMRPMPVRSNAYHRSVLEAIRVGDAARARKVHSDHRAEAKKLLLALVNRNRLYQLWKGDAILDKPAAKSDLIPA